MEIRFLGDCFVDLFVIFISVENTFYAQAFLPYNPHCGAEQKGSELCAGPHGFIWQFDKMEKFLKIMVCQSDKGNGYPKWGNIIFIMENIT